MSCPTHVESIMSLACENIRFSSLFIAGDVSQGGTSSATLRQKFRTNDATQFVEVWYLWISSKTQFLARPLSINKQVPFNTIEKKLYFETKLSSSSMSYPAFKNVMKNFSS